MLFEAAILNVASTPTSITQRVDDGRRHMPCATTAHMATTLSDHGQPISNAVAASSAWSPSHHSASASDGSGRRMMTGANVLDESCGGGIGGDTAP